MIMFDIAEWITNLMVLGLGLFFWALFLFTAMLLISECTRRINESK